VAGSGATRILLAAATDAIDDRVHGHRTTATAKCLVGTRGFVEMHDLGGSHLLDQFLDHRFTGSAES